MYEVFDSFLLEETWHTRRTADEERFYQALYKVIWSDSFNPKAMAAHMRAKCNIDKEDFHSGYALVIETYRNEARAVKNFIKYTGLTKPPET